MNILFILVAVFIGVVSQLMVKKGLNLLGPLDFSTGLLRNYLKMFASPYVFWGIIIYCLSIFFWLYALSRVDLSFAYPFLAVSYVLILLFSWMFLGESISMLRIAGVVVICFGVFLISQS